MTAISSVKKRYNHKHKLSLDTSLLHYQTASETDSQQPFTTLELNQYGHFCLVGLLN